METAIKLGATEVSNSYGGAEGEYEKEAAYNQPGIPIVASAGDDGYCSWDEVNNKKPPTLPEKPNYPSSLPTVVSVGGTSLHLNENGTRASESVWDHDGPDDELGLKNKAAEGAGSVGASSATLYASVNPRGASVSTCKFEYGTTTSYGSSVSCASLPGSGSSPVAVDAAISSGLAANTTYHYRISATNSGGTSKGTDASFKTS